MNESSFTAIQQSRVSLPIGTALVLVGSGLPEPGGSRLLKMNQLPGDFDPRSGIGWAASAGERVDRWQQRRIAGLQPGQQHTVFIVGRSEVVSLAVSWFTVLGMNAEQVILIGGFQKDDIDESPAEPLLAIDIHQGLCEIMPSGCLRW